jgi:hypothetical protein
MRINLISYKKVISFLQPALLQPISITAFKNNAYFSLLGHGEGTPQAANHETSPDLITEIEPESFN